jgi:hypothetical protein
MPGQGSQLQSANDFFARLCHSTRVPSSAGIGGNLAALLFSSALIRFLCCQFLAQLRRISSTNVCLEAESLLQFLQTCYLGVVPVLPMPGGATRPGPHPSRPTIVMSVSLDLAAELQDLRQRNQRQDQLVMELQY